MIQEVCLVCFCMVMPWMQEVPQNSILGSEAPATQENAQRGLEYLHDSPWRRGEILISERRSISGKWQLSWSDEISSEVSEFPHKCVIDLNEINGAIGGQFIGEVAGRERNAIISGRLEGTGTARVLTFQQREEGYVCSYQAIDNGGQISGVWHDTQNRSGTFRLLKYQ